MSRILDLTNMDNPQTSHTSSGHSQDQSITRPNNNNNNNSHTVMNSNNINVHSSSNTARHTPSSSGGGGVGNPPQTTNSNINFSASRFAPMLSQTSSLTPSNPSAPTNNTSGSPNFPNTTNTSSLPSVESVQAAISSIGANFNEDAVYAELTAQEDTRGYVRRPMNAFMVWSKQARRRIAMAYPNLLNCEISKLLGREWGRMSSAEKEPYVSLSTKLRENHNMLHPDYTYKPRKRRRKGEGKSMNEYDNYHMEPQVFSLSKGYSLQNPLYNTNLSTFYTTTSSGGQHRYINPSYSQSGQMVGAGSGQAMPGASYISYSNANLMKNINPSGNSMSSNLGGMPPLNYSTPSLISYPSGGKLMGQQNPNPMSMSGLGTNFQTTANPNAGAGSMSGYIDSNQPGLDLTSQQFFPSNTNFFQSLNSTTPLPNNENDSAGISNEELQNYFGGIDTTKIGNILNIYGAQEELNHPLGIGPTSTSGRGGAGPSSAVLTQNEAQNLANLGSLCASGGLYTNTSGGGTDTRGMTSTGNNDQQLTNPFLSNNPTNNPFYNLQHSSNILQQFQIDPNNTSNNDNMPQQQAQAANNRNNNSRQGPSQNDQQ